MNPVRLDLGTKSDSVPHSPASWHHCSQAGGQLSLSTTLCILAFTKSRDKTSFVFSTETPSGSFRVLGTKQSFQTRWFQLLLFLNTQDINSSRHVTLTHYVLACWHNALSYANSPATLSSCRTALLRPNWKCYK